MVPSSLLVDVSSKMALFLMCRHGETENNRAGRLSGWIDTPLTKEGVKEVDRIAAKLRGMSFDQLYASDLGRAFISSYIIARHLGFAGEIRRAKDLREASYGELGNAARSVARSAYPDLDRRTSFVPPNGESLGQMQVRALCFLSNLSAAYPGATVLIVAHDGTLNAVYADSLGADLGEVCASRHNAPDAVARFTMASGRVGSLAFL